MAVYTFNDAQVLEVIDGDTIRFLLTSDPVDVGFGMLVRGSTSAYTCRLAGIACRELKQPGGKEARQHLVDLLSLYDEKYTVTSLRWDKYAGRFDGRVLCDNGLTLAELMILDGYAVPWNGKGKQPVPDWPIP